MPVLVLVKHQPRGVLRMLSGPENSIRSLSMCHGFLRCLTQFSVQGALSAADYPLYLYSGSW